MTISEYYRILELQSGATLNEIKKAYREKARMYHPDINKAPDARDKFILATEAYEFLTSHHGERCNDEETFRQAMEDWQKYRQQRARRRASVYARSSYLRFKKSKFYRTTNVLDKTSAIISLILSVLIILYTIIGYIYRLRNPIPDINNPSVLVFLMLLSIGLIFFVTSMVYLKVYIEDSKKNKKPK
jgi:hypothetical protein